MLFGFAATMAHWLFLSSLVAADDFALYVVGTASAQDERELLYREYHYCSTDALQCRVEYRDGADELITYKTLDYRRSLTSPDLFVKAYRQEVDQRLSAGDVEELVVDAGFDNFVRNSWTDLESGTAVVFSFQPAGFEKPFKMRAKKSDDESCARARLCLRVAVNSWLLGLIASPIELAYSQDKRRLLRFRGVSNIRGVGGESVSVDIEYRYVSDA